MTSLLLEIQHRQDLDLLLNLVERLNIRVLDKKVDFPETSTGEVVLKKPRKRPAHVVVKPTRKKLRISDLKKEQGYKGMNQARLDELINKLNIQEPVEQLLAQLTP